MFLAVKSTVIIKIILPPSFPWAQCSFWNAVSKNYQNPANKAERSTLSKCSTSLRDENWAPLQSHRSGDAVCSPEIHASTQFVYRQTITGGNPSRRSQILNTYADSTGIVNDHFAFYISDNINTCRTRAEHKIVAILNDLQMITIFKLLAYWLPPAATVMSNAASITPATLFTSAFTVSTTVSDTRSHWRDVSQWVSRQS